MQYLFGTPDKTGSNIEAAFGEYLGFSGKDVSPVSAYYIGGFPGSGQAPELLGTDRDPVKGLELSQAAGMFFDFAVVTGTKTDQAGTDQAGRRLVSHCQ